MVWKKLLGAATKTYGDVKNLDLLQAIGAGGLYVVAGDGIDAQEYDQIKVSIGTNAKLTSFNDAQVNKVLAGFRTQLENSPRMAKIAVRKECEDITNPEEAEMVMAIILDVADHGGLSDSEAARAKEVAGWLRVNPADFGL